MQDVQPLLPDVEPPVLVSFVLVLIFFVLSSLLMLMLSLCLILRSLPYVSFYFPVLLLESFLSEPFVYHSSRLYVDIFYDLSCQELHQFQSSVLELLELLELLVLWLD